MARFIVPLTGCMWAIPWFRRTRQGYSPISQQPKQIIVRPLEKRSQARLSQSILDPADCYGAPKIMLTLIKCVLYLNSFLTFPIHAESRDNVILSVCSGHLSGCCAVWDGGL